MRCQETLELLNLQGWKTAMKLLRLAEDSLETVNDEFKQNDHYRLARSSFLYVEGEIYCREGNIPRALESLFSSLGVMQELLKNHTTTTRCLNSIGNCYNKLRNSEKALEFYRRAYEMRKELSGSKNHLDLPFFKGQIGTVYEAKEQYEEAIKCYQEALELCKELKRSGIVFMALFQRNIANAYAWQHKYEEAYKPAMAAYEIRKDVFGNHPHTARSAFQLGLICEALEEFEEAEDFFAEAWKIEKSLGSANHSEVRDRIVQRYEDILRGDRKKEFQEEALEFYLRFWEEEKEFSYTNKTVIDEINRRLSNSGDREMIQKYKTEALQFYEKAWYSPDLKQLPYEQTENILQNILFLCKSLRKKDQHNIFQREALGVYERQWEEEKTSMKMTPQDKNDILCTLQGLAKSLGDAEKSGKYKALYEVRACVPFAEFCVLSIDQRRCRFLVYVQNGPISWTISNTCGFVQPAYFSRDKN